MSLRRTALLASAAALAACSDSTAPTPDPLASDAPQLGATLTIAGVSALGAAGVSGLGGSLTGSPFAIAAAGTGSMPPAPSCTRTAEGLLRCSTTFSGLTIDYVTGRPDSLGTRMDMTMSGTLPAANGRPSLRIQRTATNWMEPLAGGGTSLVGTRHRSAETGTTEQLGAPRQLMTDTASTDVRMYFTNDASGAVPLPRLVGTSRRVIWTSRDGSAPSYWRETTTYDSSTVIRSLVESPAGTRHCSINLAARVIALSCN
ncbi:MAG: hypothetical protein IT355_08215 [Gemmatimonadaceae bacterium]|nr:hypothetical protein [Gemmatimonadaceae bacterium]